MKKLLTFLMSLITAVNLFAASPQLIQQATTAIDNELDREYIALKIAPLPTITDDQFIRRAYLQIIGRTPTLEEFTAFEKISNPVKRGELVRYLVNSDGYTSNMYNFWAEQLRLRERLNNTNYFNGAPYIKWIKDSIKANKPYNVFVKELLTAKGDYYTNPTVGYMQRDLGMPLDNLIGTMKVFMGTDISCAQCHDDPFQDWTQRQFYQLAALFVQAEPTGKKNPAARDKIKQLREETEEIIKNDPKQRGLNNQISNFLSATLASVNVETNKKLILPHDYRYKDALPNSVVDPAVPFGSHVIKHTEDLREDAVEWMISIDNPVFVKNIVNRYWGVMFGKPIIPRVDNIYGNDKLQESLLSLLGLVFQKLNYDSKAFIQVLGSTKLFQRHAYTGKIPDNYIFIGPVLQRLSAEQIWDSVVTIVIPSPEYFSSSYADQYAQLMNITDFNALKLDDVKAKLTQMNELNSKKFYGTQTYKGYQLVRASEINDLGANATLLNQLGRSDRELIGTSSLEGSVTQVISLMNGPVVDVATMKDSALKKNLINKSPSEKMEIIFKSILSRKPTLTEKGLFDKSSDDDLIWALINTSEFRFN